MSGFGYLIREGFRSIWSNRIMSIASICVLVSCLVLTGAAELISVNIEKEVDSVGKPMKQPFTSRTEHLTLRRFTLAKP